MLLDEEHQGVPLAEAARSCGLSTNALRLRLRRGTVDGYKNGRRLYICQSSLPADDAAPPSHEPPDGLAAHEALGLPQQVEVLQQQVLIKDRQLDEKDRQIEQLHLLMEGLQQHLPVPGAPDGKSLSTRPEDRPEQPGVGHPCEPRRARELHDHLVVQLIDPPEEDHGASARMGARLARWASIRPDPSRHVRHLWRLCRTLWQRDRDLSL